MKFLFFVCAVFPVYSNVILHMGGGQFGNQLFKLATAIALAEEHECAIYVKEFNPLAEWDGIKGNYLSVFHRIPNLIPFAHHTSSYIENGCLYAPIPYQPGIEISGYFQSEKHFKKHRDLICKMFAAPKEIEDDLNRDYYEIIEHPKTVGIHVRTWYEDFKNVHFDCRWYNSMLAPDIEYYKKAIAMFDKDSVFVVCSDNINWCKKAFSSIEANFVFIDNQDYLRDFYLLTKCKDIIMGPSTFSWWAAYLNLNPNKKAIARKPFMTPAAGYDSPDIYCEDWILIELDHQPPCPVFD